MLAAFAEDGGVRVRGERAPEQPGSSRPRRGLPRGRPRVAPAPPGGDTAAPPTTHRGPAWTGPPAAAPRPPARPPGAMGTAAPPRSAPAIALPERGRHRLALKGSGMAACLTCPPPPPSLPASSRTLPPSPAASASRPPPRPRQRGARGGGGAVARGNERPGQTRGGGEGEVAVGEAAAPLLLPAPRTAGQAGEALQRHGGRSGSRARAETWRRRRRADGSGSGSRSRQARRARPHWLCRAGGGTGGQRRAGGRAGGRP